MNQKFKITSLKFIQNKANRSELDRYDESQRVCFKVVKTEMVYTELNEIDFNRKYIKAIGV